ncbi:MAG: aminopeptidase N [Rhodospirillales bacterium]|nr:aminopeptidase N [Rhodospirillales bacterium]
MRTDTPKTIHLKDYEPPHYHVEHIDMTFKILEDHTVVFATSRMKRAANGTDKPIVLNGEHLVLKGVKLDGVLLRDGDEYSIDEKFLTIPCPAQDEFTLEIETEIDPGANTRLEGLYKSGGNWCTQCEAEGFRTITYYPDRPDVMATFKVRVEADKKTCPVLLSNGNLIEEGDVDGNRHFAVWHDPFPKPCYLFALVAGDLVHIEDTFKTKSGREVLLRIYVREGDQGQCYWAMDSLKRSMKWDEDKYGREYELDRFNIVAVSDFNMGAMENTSLNIFNTALVLAHPETATDSDFERVEGVIAHEYFHNWTGNRVTCRDWFQLSLKEGLTVFRDQEFSADMNSRDVQRIADVSMLRRLQFPEDAGPLAHPVRPDNYMEINNFYTVTVYEKGAEVIRMQHTLLGPETYRKATDLYFQRHDGQAVTCEHFVKCMADASERDLQGQFFNWYQQAGTPELKATGSYDESARRYTLSLSQKVPATPGQTSKKPMHIPVKVGLVGPNGDDMALSPPSPPASGGGGAQRQGGSTTSVILELTDEHQDFVFENIPSKPVPSILRGFSAPVKLSTDLSEDELRFLMVNDNDGFNRWEAGQTYALRMINEMLDRLEQGHNYEVWPEFIDSYSALLDQAFAPGVDKALLAQALALPDIPFIGQFRRHVDPRAIYEVREAIITAIVEREKDKLEKIYKANRTDAEFSSSFPARAQRSLQNIVLGLLGRDPQGSAVHMAKAQYDGANNMTDRVAALASLADTDSAEREAVFGDFYDRFKSYLLVIDKWFSLQAMAVRPQIMDDIRALKAHEDFTMKNPNRVRSLYGAFAMNNPVSFHDDSGSGYRFLGDAVMELNAINPQISSRLLTPLREWRRYTPDRQEKMKAVLEQIRDLPDLSPDVYEVVSKTLA